MPTATEKAIEKSIIEYLRFRGIYCQKVHSGAMFVTRGPHTYKVKLADQGTPDIMACVRGRFVGIEIKGSPEEQEAWEKQWKKHLETKEMKASWERSIFQHKEHEKICEAGGEIIVCSSIEEVGEDIEFLLAEYEAEDEKCSSPKES